MSSDDTLRFLGGGVELSIVPWEWWQWWRSSVNSLCSYNRTKISSNAQMLFHIALLVQPL